MVVNESHECAGESLIPLGLVAPKMYVALENVSTQVVAGRHECRSDGHTQVAVPDQVGNVVLDVGLDGKPFCKSATWEALCNLEDRYRDSTDLGKTLDAQGIDSCVQVVKAFTKVAHGVYTDSIIA